MCLAKLTDTLAAASLQLVHVRRRTLPGASAHALCVIQSLPRMPPRQHMICNVLFGIEDWLLWATEATRDISKQ